VYGKEIEEAGKVIGMWEKRVGGKMIVNISKYKIGA